MIVALEMTQLYCPVVVTKRVKFDALELAQLLLIEVLVATQELVQPVMMREVVVAKEKAQL